MALVATVTKKSATLSQPGMWSIVVNLVLTDNTVEVINKDFAQRYRTGQNLTNVLDKFQEELQKSIDDYKKEQLIFNNTKFDNGITILQTNLTV